MHAYSDATRCDRRWQEQISCMQKVGIQAIFTKDLEETKPRYMCALYSTTCALYSTAFRQNSRYAEEYSARPGTPRSVRFPRALCSLRCTSCRAVALVSYQLDRFQLVVPKMGVAHIAYRYLEGRFPHWVSQSPLHSTVIGEFFSFFCTHHRTHIPRGHVARA